MERDSLIGSSIDSRRGFKDGSLWEVEDRASSASWKAILHVDLTIGGARKFKRKQLFDKQRTVG